jgi:putative transposase
MPRQSRLVLPGTALHIVQRGNNRSACFVGDSDYLCYLTHLRDLSARHRCVVHAYCLMTNHVHVLVTPQFADACTNLMRDLGQCYVRYFNKRHRRTGTLWEGRYRSCIVGSARYVLACYRYIELNPVRAGMVDQPHAYQWSSHAANSGLAADVLATPHAEYLALQDEPQRRHAIYRELFTDALDDSIIGEIRDATLGSLPLGSAPFKAELSANGRKVARGRPGPRPNEPQAAEHAQLEIVL